MANAAPQLQEAYDLIESGDLESARQLLEDIRPDNENNPDYWWIYAHAVENETDGLIALDRVRQLAPNYAGLSSLSEELGISSPTPSIQSLRPPIPAPSTADVEEFYEESDGFDSQPRARRGSGLLPFIAIGSIIVIAIILGIVLLTNILGGGSDDGTPVAIASEISPEPVLPTFDSESATEEATIVTDTPTEPPTEIPTDTDEPPTEIPTDTDEPPTEIPTDTPEPEDPLAAIAEELAEFGVPEEGITVGTTETFGETYLVTTCSALGPVATQNILNIMDSLQSVADSLDEDISGIAFEITDCATDSVRLVLGIERDTAESYWSGDIEQSELQQSLQRVN